MADDQRNRRYERRPWRQILKGSITQGAQLAGILRGVSECELDRIAKRYPMRINPYYLSLIRYPGDPIWLQCVPDIMELNDEEGLEDPLNERGLSPVSNLIHKYRDRVVILVTDQCAVYCRFCNRKGRIAIGALRYRPSALGTWISYIRAHRQVREVLLSGGDPLLLADNALAEILMGLRSIPHVEIIRIGTRVPCTLPQRVTARLCSLLSRFHPIYVVTHFNHPWELTEDAQRACTSLADSGVPLANQTVLLKGVNDDPGTLKALFQGLLKIRVRPYYLFHLDHARGTLHFRTHLQRDMEILRSLIGQTSGLCIPHYALDLPGGGGKVLLWPDYGLERRGNYIETTDFMGRPTLFPLASDDPFLAQSD